LLQIKGKRVRPKGKRKNWVGEFERKEEGGWVKPEY